MNHEELHPVPWSVDSYRAQTGEQRHDIRDSLGRMVLANEWREFAESLVNIVNMACSSEAHALEIERWKEAVEAWKEDASRARDRHGKEVAQLIEANERLRERIKKLEDAHG
ncbi:MAG: hypothetical protein Unbinned4052contig1001_56 [Prokaryotic dsDNA virus sp.]|nr:MAG: hypothetical protein Unbinned4052contig1001_56 [Prokaryotic dsDNA virus sp.]